MYDPQVHIHKTVLMQRLIDAVSRGYVWHTSGTIVLDKALGLADKFAQRYNVHRNENQRAYARRKHKANTRLFMLTMPECTEINWWLVASAGSGEIHDQEQLHHALDKRHRIRVGNDYELVRRTRKCDHGGGTVCSWRMTRECIETWRIRILAACRQQSNVELRQLIGSLMRTPGFSGIRSQVGQLVAFARAEWRRRHGSLDQFPEILRLPYVERLPDISIQLSELIKK